MGWEDSGWCDCAGELIIFLARGRLDRRRSCFDKRCANVLSTGFPSSERHECTEDGRCAEERRGGWRERQLGGCDERRPDNVSLLSDR